MHEIVPLIAIKYRSQLYVLGPRHDPRRPPGSACIPVTIGKVYLPMGRELVSVRAGAAGALVGLTGLEEAVLKAATLASTSDCVPFVGLHLQV